jgi:membrane protein required for colicin V production
MPADFTPANGHWVDLALLAALAISILVGLWRGLVFEVLSLVGWVVAFVAAQFFGDEVGRMIPVGQPGDALNHGVSIAATFLLALIVWGLLSRLVRMLVRSTPLSGVDRVLGAGFGMLRALVLWLVVVTVVLMTPAARTSAWQQSFLGPRLTTWLMGLKPVLPSEVERHLPPSLR